MSVRNAIGSFFGQAASAVSGAANAVTGALTTESSPAYNTLSGSTVAATPMAPVTTRPKAGTGLVTTPLRSTQSGGRRKKSRRRVQRQRKLSRRSRRKCY